MIRWGIIGFGKIAHKFVSSITYTTDSKIIAIASKSVDENDLYLKEHPDVKLYRDYNELLENDDIDVVYIATVHKAHYKQICDAIIHKKHVLCEKPAVLHVNELEHIKVLAKEHNVFFMEALKTRVNTCYQELRKDLSYIGDVKKISVKFCSDARALKGTNSFLYDKEQGGVINDVSSYVIGFVTGLINSPIKEITSLLRNVDGICEHFNTSITYENGCIAELEGAIDELKDRTGIIEGTIGVIEIPLFNRPIEYTIINQTTTIKSFPFVGDDMTLEIEEAARCIMEGLIESPYYTLNDSIEVLKITENIRGY